MSFPEGLSDVLVKGLSDVLVGTIKQAVSDIIVEAYEEGLSDGYTAAADDHDSDRELSEAKAAATDEVVAALVRFVQMIQHREPVLIREMYHFLSIDEEQQVRRACQ